MHKMFKLAEFNTGKAFGKHFVADNFPVNTVLSNGTGFMFMVAIVSEYGCDPSRHVFVRLKSLHNDKVTVYEPDFQLGTSVQIEGEFDTDKE